VEERVKGPGTGHDGKDSTIGNIGTDRVTTMNEPEVVVRTHHELISRGLMTSVQQLYTDSHPTLLPYRELQPFQRFILDMGNFVLHPDLVGALADGETIFAIEAKGTCDHRELFTGFGQAQMYQAAFHQVYLAADAASLGETFVDFARRRNVGLIAVSDAARVVYQPVSQLPQQVAHRFVARQLKALVQVAGSETFNFNIPTHYLAWAIALRPGVDYRMGDMLATLVDYPMPKDWRSALCGAQKLGLVRLQGDVVRLTEVGAAIQDLLPDTLAEWAQVHAIVGARGHAVPLVQHRPHAAAVLRLLLLQDPMVQLVIQGLQRFPQHSASFAALAAICDQIDHAAAPIFFLKPEAVVELEDHRGRIRWGEATGEHYRSRMFYQYKSILKHAGILAETTLGGATSRTYDPERDIWTLR
jgi:hypothetical protein